MADLGKDFDDEDDVGAAFDAEPEGGEGGRGGSDAQPRKPHVEPERHEMGSPLDAVKNWANVATLGAGPQLEGAMAAVTQDAKNLIAGEPFHPKVTPAEAYREVRDMGAKEHEKSADTWWGRMATLPGMLSTPVPIKALPKGASTAAKAEHGMHVGALTGGLHGAINSDVDFTNKDNDWSKYAELLKDTGWGTGGGALLGGAGGATLGRLEKPLRSTAETQALRAAGLQSGIKNSVQKDLGVVGMDEARKVGRRFLDEGLIPPIGSSESVAARAKNLEQQAGNSIGATLAKAETSGKFDAKANADAVRKMLADESAVADLLSGEKARLLADALEAQGRRTPGSFVGQNKAKSDAWKSANFAADAPMAPVLYRKGVGAARDDIERQVSNVLGPEDGAALRSANEQWGVAADAQKLANNRATRDAAKKGFGLPEILAMTTGAGAAGGHAVGHGAEGALGGLAVALGAKGFDKYGHSSAARLADFLANRTARNTGGGVGGSAGSTAASALAKYLDALGDDEQPPNWGEFVKGSKQ